MTVEMWDTPDLQSWRSAGHPSLVSSRVESVMSWPAIVAEPSLTTDLAMRAAREHRIHHLPVVLNGDLIGVVCTCDLAEASPGDALALHMRDRAITISPHATLREAAERMDDYQINSLVTLWHSCWGIVTRGDLIRAGAARRRVCKSCGDGHHVRRHPLYPGLFFCNECLEPRSDPFARYYDDQGGG
jgi:CBS domain-containing protein